MNTRTFKLELRPRIPAKLRRLEELANNLVYSWDRDIRGLFWRLDRQLWIDCGNNPKLFLRRVAQDRLDSVAEGRDFMEDYNRALSSFDSYMTLGPRPEIDGQLDRGTDLIAYFCAEFGLHESLHIYSGGLGILAGDHCKAASDLGLPFVAVGLLYRQGYFIQTIDGTGRQQAHAHVSDFDELPIQLCRDAHNAEVRVGVEIGGTHRSAQGVARPCRACPVVSAGQRRGGKCRGGSPHHSPVIRRRLGYAYPAGNRPGCRRRTRDTGPGPCARRLPYERRTRGIFVARTHPRTGRRRHRLRYRAGTGRRRQRVHHTYAGAGGARPLQPRPDALVPAETAARAWLRRKQGARPGGQRRGSR